MMNEHRPTAVHFASSSGTPDDDNGTRIRGKRFLLPLVAVLVVGAFVTGGGLRFLFHMYNTLPSPTELQSIEPSLVSKVIGADGSVIHEFSVERRFWVSLDDIPRPLQEAVIAIEDRRFYKHWGIDIKRIIGAIVVDVVRREFAQGASTLTQQLARNVYLTSRQTLIRKIREAMTAVQIESYFTKREIMELYLNQVYLGAGVYGVEAASQRYFSKPVKDLTLNECTVMAGLIQLPEHYRPDKPRNIDRITRRRASVVYGMRTMGYLSREQAEAVLASPIPSDPQKRMSRIAPYFVEMVRRQIEERYGEKELYHGGMTIYTTLDPFAQDSAERASADHLVSLQRTANRQFLDSTKTHVERGIAKKAFLDNFDSLYATRRQEYEALPDSMRRRIVQVAVVALDNRTGAIRALIGGRDFAESKFNRATQARRQPGSSFKPFVYATALDSAYTPATVVLDQAITLETDEGLWRPENYDHQFNGPVTIRTALKKSINLVAIQVLMDVGPMKVIQTARNMGLSHRLNPVPALAIGACEATPFEMARAYSIFANLGTLRTPYFIEKVVDRDGRVLEEHEPDEERQVLAPPTAYLMTSLLRSVVTGGTGATIPAKGFVRPASGKTGTTNNYSDAWFVGFTPQITCAVWVGVDERRSMGRGITGSRGAIPIWLGTMFALHRDLPIARFSRPAGITSARICDKTHGIATRYCPVCYDEVFDQGSLPDTCDVHVLNKRRRNDNRIDMFGSDKRERPSEKATKKKRKRSLMF
jgi:penicillin-binding protein 1A